MTTEQRSRCVYWDVIASVLLSQLRRVPQIFRDEIVMLAKIYDCKLLRYLFSACV